MLVVVGAWCAGNGEVRGGRLQGVTRLFNRVGLKDIRDGHNREEAIGRCKAFLMVAVDCEVGV